MDIEHYRSVYILSAIIALLANWSACSTVKAEYGERNQLAVMNLALETIGWSGFFAVSWLFSYIFIFLGIGTMIYAHYQIWSLLDWKDIIWTSAAIGFIGQRQFSLARYMMRHEYLFDGMPSNSSVNTQLFGLILMIAGVLYSLFAKDAPLNVATIFDFIP